MVTDEIDDERARALGAAVATHSHEDLPASRIEELADLTSRVSESIEDERAVEGATLLLEFWTGHVARTVGTEATPITPDETIELFEDGFDAGALGVDLYQALTKVATAIETAATAPDLGRWTDRLFELTNRHVAHLESHQHDS